MSGRGNNREFRRTGRGRGYKTSEKIQERSATTEIKFVPYYTGKQQSVTFDTVKDAIMQNIQKTYSHGVDMTHSLRDMKLKDLTLEKPKRSIASKTEVESNGTAKSRDKDDIQIEQNGLDIEFRE